MNTILIHTVLYRLKLLFNGATKVNNFFHIFKLTKAAKRELERQRQLEWERNRRQELLNQRNKEQEDIVVLKAKKKTLEFELEALVSEKHLPNIFIIVDFFL